jgi:hypothetical protein
LRRGPEGGREQRTGTGDRMLPEDVARELRMRAWACGLDCCRGSGHAKPSSVQPAKALGARVRREWGGRTPLNQSAPSATLMFACPCPRRLSDHRRACADIGGTLSMFGLFRAILEDACAVCIVYVVLVSCGITPEKVGDPVQLCTVVARSWSQVSITISSLGCSAGPGVCECVSIMVTIMGGFEYSEKAY